MKNKSIDYNFDKIRYLLQLFSDKLDQHEKMINEIKQTLEEFKHNFQTENLVTTVSSKLNCITGSGETKLEDKLTVSGDSDFKTNVIIENQLSGKTTTLENGESQTKLLVSGDLDCDKKLFIDTITHHGEYHDWGTITINGDVDIINLESRGNNNDSGNQYARLRLSTEKLTQDNRKGKFGIIGYNPNSSDKQAEGPHLYFTAYNETGENENNKCKYLGIGMTQIGYNGKNFTFSPK